MSLPGKGSGIMMKREIKGINILKIDGSVKPVEDGKVYLIRSESDNNTWYRVYWDGRRWACECKDYLKRGGKCKHIWCLIYWLALRRIATVLRNEYSGNICPHCGSGKYVVKRGFRYNRSGPRQIYYCKVCKKAFTERSPFLKMKHDAATILAALDLYFKGLSLRKVRDHLMQFYGEKVHHTTILKWIRKYSKLINEYLDGLDMELGERWSADETVVKVSGRHLRLWALMDTETKMLIAYRISEKRTAEEAEKLFEEGISKAGKAPLEVVTDGFSGYHKALEKISSNMPGEPNDRLIHVYGPLTGEINNNIIERFFGELKSRVSTMRGIKNEDSFSDMMQGLIGLYNINKLKKTNIQKIIERAYLSKLYTKSA